MHYNSVYTNLLLLLLLYCLRDKIVDLKMLVNTQPLYYRIKVCNKPESFNEGMRSDCVLEI